MRDRVPHYIRGGAIALYSIPAAGPAGILYTWVMRSVLMCISQAGAGNIGYSIFKVMSVVPVLGVMTIRIIETFTVSHSIILTVCVAVISTMSAEVPPSVMAFYRRVKSWVGRWGQEGVDVERGPEQMVGLGDGRLASIQVKWVLY